MEARNELVNGIDAPLEDEKTKDLIQNDSSDQETENHVYQNRILEVSEENENLRLIIEKLKTEASNIKNQHTDELEKLEKTVGLQRAELENFQTASRLQAEKSEKQLDDLKNEYAVKIEKLSKQCEEASKGYEAMVMKYAVSENGGISLKNQIKQLENKIRNHAKEKKALEGKIDHLVNDKAELSQTIDSKRTEITSLEREIQKKKDEFHAQSSNLKYFQNKLKLEFENQKDVQLKLDEARQKLKEAKEETEQVRKDGQSILMRYEEEGRQELEIQYADEVNSLHKEVNSWRTKHKDLTDENNQLCKKIQNLETERLDYEENLSKLKQSLYEHQQSLADYYSVKAELESSGLMLTREQERCISSQAEIERLRMTNQEIQQEMTKCREREAELLNFTRKLTEKNVAIQSDLISIEARAQQQEIELGSINRQACDLSTELKNVQSELTKNKQQRLEEFGSLSQQLKERIQMVERLSIQVEDLKGENQLLKKKHLASIKELTRELHAYRKRGEALETTSLGKTSHTSSNTSLNDDDSAESRIVQVTNTEFDPQLLIDKIVAVQKLNAEMRERKAFLKENNRHLISELQKKSRIIQNLVLKQNSGSLSSELMDENKSVLGKALVAAALAKQGGIMASVYSSKPVDDTMTLELSLEMNQKLQAVLEDTLLKNFMLTENMDTLGNEISKLKLAAAQSQLLYPSKS